MWWEGEGKEARVPWRCVLHVSMCNSSAPALLPRACAAGRSQRLEQATLQLLALTAHAACAALFAVQCHEDDVVMGVADTPLIRNVVGA